jgi:UDP-glucuronate decarboxylase
VARVGVTGGAGFLGSYLSERLIALDQEVVCVDNFSSGSRRNIEHLLGERVFSVVEHDVCVPLVLEVDEIYNLACPASPVMYQRDPVQTTRTSVLGSLNLLELAKQTGAKILQASTSEIYGDPLVHPQREDYWGNVNTVGPRACYDEGKRCAETLFYDYQRQHDLRIRVARIFNTYGPRMHPEDGRVVSNFVVQALKNHDISIYGRGTQTRSFCYRDDLVDGLVRLMNADDGAFLPINLGNSHEISIRELAETIIDLTGSRSKLIHLSLPADDPVQRQPDIARAGTVLGWTPTTDLRDGLSKTIAYFERELEAA